MDGSTVLTNGVPPGVSYQGDTGFPLQLSFATSPGAAGKVPRDHDATDAHMRARATGRRKIRTVCAEDIDIAGIGEGYRSAAEARLAPLDSVASQVIVAVPFAALALFQPQVWPPSGEYSHP